MDVFKTDFGEDIPADAVFHDGRTGATMHNLYPLLYNRAVAEVTKEEHARRRTSGAVGFRGRSIPIQSLSGYDARFPRLRNPDAKTHACPAAADPVVFEIAKVREG